MKVRTEQPEAQSRSHQTY